MQTPMHQLWPADPQCACAAPLKSSVARDALRFWRRLQKLVLKPAGAAPRAGALRGAIRLMPPIRFWGTNSKSARDANAAAVGRNAGGLGTDALMSPALACRPRQPLAHV